MEEVSEKKAKLYQLLKKKKLNWPTIWSILGFVEDLGKDVDTIIELAERDDSTRKDIVEKWWKLMEKLPYEVRFKKADKQLKPKTKTQKRILMMSPSDQYVGDMKLYLGDKDIEYFSFPLWDFNVCQLPKDIYDDNELYEVASKWVYPPEWNVKRYKELRSIDYNKYERVIVWNDMRPSSLMFLYTICKFVKCDIEEIDASTYVSPGLYDEDPDLDSVFKTIRIIPEEEKKWFSDIYDSFAGKPMCAKKADGYDIIVVPDDEIRQRILECSEDEFMHAAKLVSVAAYKDLSDQESVGYEYVWLKLREMIEEGLFDVKQTRDPSLERCEDEAPYIVNGVDISVKECIAVKRKSLQ